MPVIINGSTGISGTDGSAGTPAVQGTDGNTGMFFRAADQIAFAEGGVEAMRLDASGNVGIGVTTMGYRLVVSSNGGTDATFISATGGVAYVGAVGAKPLVFETNATERVRITSGGDFQFNSGYGSVATAFACRAWVNFNGTGTVSIRASGNVSSITDNGTGDYTVNFTNGMPDANYATVCDASDTGNWGTVTTLVTTLSGSQRIYTLLNNGTSLADPGVVCVAVFR